jgi:hypothetical protein
MTDEAFVIVQLADADVGRLLAVINLGASQGAREGGCFSG